MRIYSKYYSNTQLLQQLIDLLSKQGNVFLWGAGLKGYAFLAMTDKEKKIAGVLDINENIIGKQLLTGHFIKSYKTETNMSFVLLMNTMHEESVLLKLDEYHDKFTIINVDCIIEGELTLNEIIQLYNF